MFAGGIIAGIFMHVATIRYASVLGMSRCTADFEVSKPFWMP
jgi:hypothetical protein